MNSGILYATLSHIYYGIRHYLTSILALYMARMHSIWLLFCIILILLAVRVRRELILSLLSGRELLAIEVRRGTF